FDAHWVTSMAWNQLDQPSIFPTLGVPGLAVNQADLATVASTLLKPLPTGGVAGITFRTDYQLTNDKAALVNPSYRPVLQFVFDQPLLQGFGVEINQLRSTLPGPSPGIPGFSPPAGFLPGFPLSGLTEGIVITRLRFDQQRAEFERNVAWMLINVEIA